MKLQVLSGLFGIVLISACGGGGGGKNDDDSSGGGGTTTPQVELMLYVADQEVDGRNELYFLDTDMPGVATKLNASLITGGDVSLEPLFSSDASQVIYLADAVTDNVFDLWLVDVNQPEIATQLNPILVAGGNIHPFTALKLGTDQVLYRADQDVDDQFELYLVSLDNPGTATRINPVLDTDEDVNFGFQLSPNQTQVLYLADMDTDTINELYLTDLSSPGTSKRMNGTLVADGDVSSFVVSPDGSQIAYRADEQTDTVLELFLVNTGNPGVSQKLNANLVAGGSVLSYQFTPDDLSIVYISDQDVDDQAELYKVDVNNPGVSTRLNPALDADEDISFIRVIPDSSGVAYTADQDVEGTREFYLVRFANPGTAIKLNSSFPLGPGGISNFDISPDGKRVYYVSEENLAGQTELHVVELDNPGISARINPPLAASRFGVANPLPFRPDSERVAYLLDEADDGMFEVFIGDINKPDQATRMNGPLVSGGEVINESEAIGFFP